MGSTEQTRGAHVVAQELLRRQERLQRFEQGRQRVLEQERLIRERTAAALEAADARCARQQRERQVANNRRAFEAQQRRSEQQKVFREFKREQERACEAYYLQNTSKSVSKLGSDSVFSNMERSRSAPSLSGLSSSGIPEDDIYDSILQSHLSYNGVLEKAEKFVAENERRTQAQRRKVLASSYSRGGVDDDDGDRFRARRDAQKAKASPSTTCKSGEKMSVGSDLSLGGASLSGSLPRVSASWSLKRESCLNLAAEKFKQSQEKLMRDKAALQNARDKIDMMNKAKAEAASELNSTWQQKANLAMTTTKRLQVKSGDALAQRQAAVDERLEQDRLLREQQRAESALNRANQTEASKIRAQSLLEDRLEKNRSTLSRKEAVAQEIGATTMRNFENNITSTQTCEEARVRQRKESVQLEFLDRARQNAESKHERSLKVLEKQRLSMLDLAREARRDKASNSQGPVAEDNREHSVPSPLGTAGGVSAHTAPHAANLSELAEQEAELVAALLASGGSVHEENYLHMPSDAALEDERELIQEVEARSTKWLGETAAKRRSKKKVWKPS